MTLDGGERIFDGRVCVYLVVRLIYTTSISAAAFKRENSRLQGDLWEGGAKGSPLRPHSSNTHSTVHVLSPLKQISRLSLLIYTYIRDLRSLSLSLDSAIKRAAVH